MKLLRHARNIPGKLGAVINSLAQVHQFMVIRGEAEGTGAHAGSLLQLGKKKLEKLIHYPFIVLSGKGVFPGD